MNSDREKNTSFFDSLVDESLPGNSIDCVIFGYNEQQLKVLLLQWKAETGWSLPGGFIHVEEDMDHAAHRILTERTGLKSVFLNQFVITQYGESGRKEYIEKIVRIQIGAAWELSRHILGSGNRLKIALYKRPEGFGLRTDGLLKAGLQV